MASLKKRIMKKYLLITILATSFCYSCNKELKSAGVDHNSFYIKATLNGELRTFSDNPSAGEYPGDLSAGFNMMAEDKKDAAEFTLNIIHPFGMPLTTGTYGNIATGYIPSGHYRLGDVISYESGINSNTSTLNITISGISNTSVSGTFNGSLINMRDTNAVMTITNGSFNLPVHQ